MSTEAASVPWTPEQDAVLRSMWAANATRPEIAAHLGRSLNSVNARSKRLDLLPKVLWSKEREERLAQLWADHVQDHVIAEMFGLTRSAIKNKVQRLKLPPRHMVRQPQLQKRATWRSYGHRGQVRLPSKPVPMPTTVPEPVTTPVGLLDRTGCAWPVNDGGPFLFCNHPTEGTYCEHHHQRMYRPW